MTGIDDRHGPLLTDLYQLTMLQAYFDRGMNAEATFEFFVRRLPPERSFLVAAGLEQVLEYLEALSFDDDDIATLRETGLFSDEFLDYLRQFRFAGEVYAMPEGSVFFANEPILGVTATLPAAQFIESRVVNLLHYQTLVASKAARCVLAAPGKALVDFGMRRAHGGEAAILAARASYLAGFAGTATVVAKRLFGIPIFGTMAHSFIEAHDTEAEAFEHFATCHRGPIVLLIDTYDTETGARRVVELTKRRADIRIQSVRLDSGDLGSLAASVRRLLDDGDGEDIRIFASGGLDEYQLEELTARSAPIEGFGIGTNLDVSSDCPALDCVYKLQEYAGRPRRKRSQGKATWPGRKQVYRSYDGSGHIGKDVLTLADFPTAGEALLEAVMVEGRRIAAGPTLETIRRRTRSQLDRLTPALRSLTNQASFEVEIAAVLRNAATAVDEAFH